MARFSTMQEAETPEQKRKRLEADTLASNPSPAAANGASPTVMAPDLNIPQPAAQPRFSTQAIGQNNVEAAKHVIAPEATPDPNAQVHSQSSSYEDKIPSGYGLAFDPRNPGSDPNFAEMNKRIAAMPTLMESRNRMMDQPTGLGHKLMGIGSAIGGSLLGGNAMQMYDLGAHGPQRAAAKPLTEQLDITQNMLGAMKEFEPLSTARINAENMRGQVERMNSSNDVMKVGEYPGADGKKHFVYAHKSDPTHPFEIDAEGNMQPAAARGMANSTMTVEDALKFGDTVVKWADGGPGATKDLREMPPDAIITRDSFGNYFPGSQRETTVTTGNLRTRMGIFEDRPDQASILGQANTGTNTMRTAPLGTNAKGQQIIGQLPGSSTPNTPGLFNSQPNVQAPAPFQAPPQGGQAPPAMPSQPPPQPALTQPVAPNQPVQKPVQSLSQRRTPQPAPTAQNAAPAAIGGGVRNVQALPGIYPPAEAKAFRDQVVPTRVGLTSLINDPEHPIKNSLMDFSNLADDAGSRQRLGVFTNLLFDSMTSAQAAQGDISAGAGGVNVSTGKLGSYLSNKLGLPGMAAGAQAQALDAAHAALTPAEQEYVSALTDAMETAPGFRKNVGSGVYEYAITALQRTLPVFGRTGVTNSAIYKDKIKRMVQQNQVGLAKVPDDFLTYTGPDGREGSLRGYYDQKIKELESGSGTTAPPPGGGAPQRRFRIER